MDTRTLQQVSAKGFHVVARTASPEEWSSLVASDPDIPRDYQELLALARCDTLGGDLPDRLKHLYDDECGTHVLEMIEDGLANPDLKDEEIDRIDETLAAEPPDLPDKFSTDNFEIYYDGTGKTGKEKEHLFSLNDVHTVASFIERAFAVYTREFGRKPYCGKGKNKIVVKIFSFPKPKPPRKTAPLGKTSPEGPIQLNAFRLRGEKNALLRCSTPAHELFHRLQFSFGYRTFKKERPADPYKWFSEGSASWGALYATDGLSNPKPLVKKEENVRWCLDQTRGSTRKAFFVESSYKALPFWVYLQTMELQCPPGGTGPGGVRSTLERYERDPGRRSHFNSVGTLSSMRAFSQFVAALVANVWRRQGKSLEDRLCSGCESYSHIQSADPDDGGKEVDLCYRPSARVDMKSGLDYVLEPDYIRPYAHFSLQCNNNPYGDGKQCVIEVRMDAAGDESFCVTQVSVRKNVFKYLGSQVFCGKGEIKWQVNAQEEDSRFFIILSDAVAATMGLRVRVLP